MQRKIKQVWAFIFLLLLTVTYLTINLFEFKSSEEGVKCIYFADRMTLAHKELIEKYNELHSGKIRVIPIDFPNGDFSTNERKEVVARSLRGRGDGIDLFAVDIIWVTRFAKWAEPLDIYFTAQEKNNLLDQALATCYSNGQLAAVPLDIVQTVLYYREDILKAQKNCDEITREIQKGMTWDEFVKLKSSLALNNPFYIFPAADYEGLVCSYIQLLLSLDPKYFQDKGFYFETPQAEKSLQLLVDLVNKYKVSPDNVSQFTEIQSYDYFMRHDGIFLLGWPTYYWDFKDSPYDSVKQSNLKKAPVPYFSSGQPTSVLGGWDLMVSKFSDKKPEVISFVKFLLSDESQEIFFRDGGYYPILKKFYEDSTYLNRYPELANFKRLMKTEVSRPSNPEYTKYSKIMSFYFNEAIQNKISVKQALIESSKAIATDKLILQ